MVVRNSDRDDEFDRYDPEYPEDGSEYDLVVHDAAAELDQERRDARYEQEGQGRARNYR